MKLRWKHSELQRRAAKDHQGMTREQFEAEQDDLRREIVDNVGWMKPRIISELLRIQGLRETYAASGTVQAS